MKIIYTFFRKHLSTIIILILLPCLIVMSDLMKRKQGLAETKPVMNPPPNSSRASLIADRGAPYWGGDRLIAMSKSAENELLDSLKPPPVSGVSSELGGKQGNPMIPSGGTQTDQRGSSFQYTGYSWNGTVVPVGGGASATNTGNNSAAGSGSSSGTVSTSKPGTAPAPNAGTNPALNSGTVPITGNLGDTQAGSQPSEPVPEPPTWVLIASGILLLLWLAPKGRRHFSLLDRHKGFPSFPLRFRGIHSLPEEGDYLLLGQRR